HASLGHGRGTGQARRRSDNPSGEHRRQRDPPRRILCLHASLLRPAEQPALARTLAASAPELTGPVPSTHGPCGSRVEVAAGGAAHGVSWRPIGSAIIRAPGVRREESAMATRIGYLLPAREQVMAGRPEAAPLIALAERAADLGFDSIGAGDSLLARPRHDPLTLLAAVGGRVPRVELGTAVLLPALRNPVVLAQQVATLDQISEGRVILGV